MINDVPEAIKTIERIANEFQAEVIHIDKTLVFSKKRIEQYLPKGIKEVDKLRNHNGKKK